MFFAATELVASGSDVAPWRVETAGVDSHTPLPLTLAYSRRTRRVGNGGLLPLLFSTGRFLLLSPYQEREFSVSHVPVLGTTGLCGVVTVSFSSRFPVARGFPIIQPIGPTLVGRIATLLGGLACGFVVFVFIILVVTCCGPGIVLAWPL